MAEISYRGHRFPSAIIQHAVWPYLALHAELSRRRGTPRPDPCARRRANARSNRLAAISECWRLRQGLIERRSLSGGWFSRPCRPSVEAAYRRGDLFEKPHTDGGSRLRIAELLGPLGSGASRTYGSRTLPWREADSNFQFPATVRFVKPRYYSFFCREGRMLHPARKEWPIQAHLGGQQRRRGY